MNISLRAFLIAGMNTGNDVTRTKVLQPITSRSRYPKTADHTPPREYIGVEIIKISSRLALFEASFPIITLCMEKFSPMANPMRARARRRVAKLATIAQTTELKIPR
jgi:hypothetical protein